MKKKLLVTLIFTALAGCTTTAPDGTQETNRAATGAIIGAIGGAIVGNNTGSSRTHTAMGAVVGAGIGAAIGNSLDEQEREFKRQLAAEEQAREIEVERVREDLLRLTVNNEVSFDFDKATIRPSFRDSLDKIAGVLTKYGRSRVIVVGHTDSVGSERYNQRLSEQRANSVADYLATRRVERSRITAKGAGESEPRASNGSEAGRQLNRRVEIFVQPEAQS